MRALSILVLLSFALQACLAVSEQPLSDPAAAKHDERLTGLWKAIAEEDEVYVHIAKSLEDNRTRMIFAEHRNDSSLDTIQLYAFSTKIGESYFLNLQLETMSGEKRTKWQGYIFARYSFKGCDELSLAILSPDAIEHAIKEGKLKGVVPKEQIIKTQNGRTFKHRPFYQEITITEGTQNLITFLSTQDQEALFPETVRFKRLKH